MPSFIVGSDNPTSMLWVQVHPDTTYSWYRVFVRLTSDPNSSVFDQWYNATSAFYADVTGLAPGTSYTINVAYNTTPSASGSRWIGAQTYVTSGGTAGYSATLVFNANGGYGAPASASGESANQYVPITVPYAQPTRQGYTFLGWSLDQAATAASYYPGSTYNWYGTPYGYTHTLYAVWSKSGGGAYVWDGYSMQEASVYINRYGFERTAPYIFNYGWKKGT